MEQKGKDLIMHQADLTTNKEFKAITNCGYYSNVLLSITNNANAEDVTCTYELNSKDAKLLIAFLQITFDL